MKIQLDVKSNESDSYQDEYETMALEATGSDVRISVPAFTFYVNMRELHKALNALEGVGS